MYAGDVNNGGSFRTAMAPFYSPGILCNSIKSGISVGYPVFTSSFNPNLNVTGTYLSNSSGTSVYDDEGPRISGSFNYRLPFESILNPLAALDPGTTTIVDSEPDPTAILSSTASFDSDASGDVRYTYAVNNFLAETMNLFLKNRSVSSLISNGENSFTFTPGKEYRMKVRVFEEGMDMYDGDKSYGPPTDDSLSLNGTRASQLPFLPPYDVGTALSAEGIEFIFNPTADRHGVEHILNNLTESYTIYRDLDTTSGVSLALDGRTKITDSIQFDRKLEVGNSSRTVPGTPEYAISFQPKWESPVLDFSHRTASISVTNTNAAYSIEVDSLPANNDTLTISDGFRDIVYTFKSSSPSGDYQILIGGSKPATATNIRNKIPFNGSTMENNFTVGGSGTTITLTAKAPGKLPHFASSFAGTSVSLICTSTNGTGFYDGSSVSDNYYVGMWHQHGRIPTGSQGIKMQITGPPPISTTGSLAQALGFTNEAVKIGEIAESRTVKEAIVAIPYFQVDRGEKALFPIDSMSFNTAMEVVNGTIERPDGLLDEYLKLARRGKQFVLPPQLDFFYRDVNPFAMFIFDFNMKLNRQDLADIWQNLPPTSTSGKKDLASGFDKEESTMTAQYGGGRKEDWFPDGIPKDTRWMVFKVKQRAAYDYYEQTRDSSLAKGFRERVETDGEFVNPIYSYNWPYDFFSFVELAKVDAAVDNRAADNIGAGAIPLTGEMRRDLARSRDDATPESSRDGVAESRTTGGGLFTGE